MCFHLARSLREGSRQIDGARIDVILLNIALSALHFLNTDLLRSLVCLFRRRQFVRKTKLVLVARCGLNSICNSHLLVSFAALYPKWMGITIQCDKVNAKICSSVILRNFHFKKPQFDMHELFPVFK